jgi:hypothetical protein
LRPSPNRKRQREERPGEGDGAQPDQKRETVEDEATSVPDEEERRGKGGREGGHQTRTDSKKRERRDRREKTVRRERESDRREKRKR